MGGEVQVRVDDDDAVGEACEEAVMRPDATETRWR